MTASTDQGDHMIRILTLAGCVALAGCTATPRELVATGGSRSDATVELSYESWMFENSKLDFQQGLATAIDRCRGWGYASAEPFGGEKRQCQLPSQYGCQKWFVTMTYQCMP